MRTSRLITPFVSLRLFTLALLLLFVSPAMGAKWTETPIETVASIAGEWRGSGITSEGFDFTIYYVFKEDGSYEADWLWGTGTGTAPRPPGKVRLNGGKLQWKGTEGLVWTVTLYKGKKGRRMLKGHREDGMTWQLKQKK